MEVRKIFTKIAKLVGVDNANENYIIVEQYPEIEYTLIYRNSKYEPWVAAWCYYEDKGYWGQGHYFATVKEAIDYINEVLAERGRRV